MYKGLEEDSLDRTNKPEYSITIKKQTIKYMLSEYKVKQSKVIYDIEKGQNLCLNGLTTYSFLVLNIHIIAIQSSYILSIDDMLELRSTKKVLQSRFFLFLKKTAILPSMLHLLVSGVISY